MLKAVESQIAVASLVNDYIWKKPVAYKRVFLVNSLVKLIEMAYYRLFEGKQVEI